MFGLLKQDSLVKKGLKLMVFFSVLLTPLVFSIKHIYFFSTPKYVLLAFAGSVCFVLLIFYFLETKFLLDKRLKIALGMAIVFIAWLFLSSLLGVNPETSFWSNFGRHTGFITYFFSFILFFCSVLIFDKKTFFAPLKAFTVGGALAALSVYLSPALLGLDFLFLNNSGNGGTFGNTTYAGIFLAFSLFSALIIFFKEEARNKKWFWIGCFLFILLSPIFLNIKGIFTGKIDVFYSILGDARAGLVSILIGLILSAILYFYFNEKKTYAIFAKIMLVLVFVSGIYTTTIFLDEGSRLHQAIKEQKEGVRFFYLDMAEIGIAERPILGWGLENFPLIHNKYFNPILLSPEYPIETWADKPHNVILEMAFSAGIPGLALYLSLIGFAFIALIRKASALEASSRITASLFFGLLVSYNFQLFFAFETISSIQALFITLALIFVFCFADTQYINKKKLNGYIKIIATILLVMLGITMIYLLSFRVGKESKMIRQLNTASIQKRISLFKETMNKSPVGTLTTESQHIDLMVGKYKKNWNTLTSEVKEIARDELEFLFEHSKARSDEFPEDFRFALVTAKIANVLFVISEAKDLQMLESAKKYGIRAINNSPTGELGYQILVEAFLAEGKLDRALNFAEMLVGLNGRLPEFHNLVIYIAKIKKDQKLVDEKTENAKKLIPHYQYGLGR